MWKITYRIKLYIHNSNYIIIITHELQIQLLLLLSSTNTLYVPFHKVIHSNTHREVGSILHILMNSFMRCVKKFQDSTAD